jgi:hypothetical protein
MSSRWLVPSVNNRPSFSCGDHIYGTAIVHHSANLTFFYHDLYKNLLKLSNKIFEWILQRGEADPETPGALPGEENSSACTR